MSADVQRRATPLEQTLNALGTTNYIMAGLGDALTGGGSVTETVPRALREHRDFTDLLRERGVTNPWIAIPAGFALDVATDPISYLGIGAVTKAGKLAKSAEFAARLAKVSGRAEDIAEAARLAERAAAAGAAPFVEGLGSQARAGHRSLVSVAGKPVVKGAPVLGALEKAGGAIRGGERAGAALRGAESFIESESSLRGLDRDVFKALKRRTAGEQALAIREVDRRISPLMSGLNKAARELGLEPEKVIDDLADYVEGPFAAGINPRHTMTPEEVAKYDRWRREATATANAGTPEYVVNTGRPTEVFMGDRTVAGELVVTHPSPQAGTIIGPANKRGALDFRTTVGIAPDEIRAYLPTNSYKALRRIENAALERARAQFIPSQELEPLFKAIRAEHDDLMKSWLGKTQAAGIDIRELMGLGYMRHKVTREAAEAIEKYGPQEFRGIGREVTEQHGAQMQRALSGAFDLNGNLVELGLDEAQTAAKAKALGKPLRWRPLTRNEANKLAEEGKLAVTGYRPVKGGLFEGPGVAAAFRSAEAAKAIGGAEMIRGYAGIPGMAEDLSKIADKAARAARKQELIRQGWRPVPNNLKGVGDDVLFRGDIGEALAKHGERILPPDNRAIKAVVEGYDEALRAWKSWTLGVFPVFHTRNEIDDLFRAFGYAGMKPGRLADAAKVTAWGTKAWRGGVEPIFEAGGRRWRASEIQELLVKHGVVDTGQMSEVLNKLGSMRKARGFERVGDNAVTRAGKEVGRVRENWTRTALFLDGLKRGMSPAEAASRTATFLFDYGDLSKFEQQVMRRAFPFYTYTRKNVPLQLKQLIRRPGIAAGVQKAREATTGDEYGMGLGETPLSIKLRESMPMRVGSTPEGNPQFLRLAGQLGLADLNTVLSPRGAFERAQDLLTPAISTPLEMAFNYDAYRDMPLEEYPGQTTSMVGVPVSSRWAQPVLSNFRPLSELDRLFAINKDYAVPSTWQRIANLAIGRTYAQDPAARAAGSQAAVEREVRRLQAALRRARTDAEVERIIAEIQRVVEHPETLR